MADADLLIEEVSSYLKPQDVEHVRAAVEFSRIAHQGQTRHSGDPYVTHPIAVARILTPLHLDVQSIIAALLHDVVEDTEITAEQIAKEFGRPVAELVDGLSKLEKIHFETREDAQAENFRKMLLAMARDVRVILIKLADRLHNMRTLDSMRPEQCERIARETMEIYAPIANRLGLNEIYQELQDLSFKHLHPNRYAVLAKALKVARGNRREVVSKILDSIIQQLAKKNIRAEVTGREKNIYSIYKKMQIKSLAFSEVLDIYGFRVLVDDVDACYVALGVLHALYKPIPGKFKDYIAIPKSNGYQSLHTTVIGPGGMPLEIQIRTNKMNDAAEIGVAGHWLYKGIEKEEKFDKKLAWLKQLIDWQRQTPGAGSELKNLELFENTIYALTPKGDVIELPEKATVLDFAFAVHTELGFKCIRAVVNGKPVPLNFELKNGDTVQIFTSQQQKPRTQWLGFVKTSKAKAKIKQRLNIKQAKKTAAKPLRKQVVKTSDKRIRIANCCNPLLGEEIVGFKTTKRKISVHRKSCLQLNSIPAEKLINVEWEHKQGTDYIVELKVTGKDRVGEVNCGAHFARFRATCGCRQQSSGIHRPCGRSGECREAQGAGGWCRIFQGRRLGLRNAPL